MTVKDYGFYRWSEEEKQEKFAKMEEVASNGGHQDAMSQAIGLKSTDTFYTWKREIAEFAEQVNHCKMLSKIFYESLALRGAAGLIKNFNAPMLMMIMNNKFSEEYKRGNGGSNTEVNINTISLSPSQLQQEISNKLQILHSLGDDVVQLSRLPIDVSTDS